MRYICYGFAGGMVLGTIGFVCGFYGPLVFMPEANQGPLLGIFITGPLGFILCIVAGIYAARKSKPPPDPTAKTI